MVKTTLAGTYPKPDYLFIGDARSLIDQSGNNFYELANSIGQEEFNNRVERAVEDVVNDLNEADLDVITDGEVGRDHYIHYHLRHWAGFDYVSMGTKKLRSGGDWDERPVPRVTDKIAATTEYIVNDYKRVARLAKNSVKVTLPGTSTLINFTQNEFYKSKIEFAEDISKALRQIVEALYNEGCRNFQFDDPVLMRDSKDMNDWGIASLEKAIEGFRNITTGVHVCLGYPNKKLEASGIPYKADERNYAFLLKSLQNSKIDQVSIEAEQSKLDLDILEYLGDKSILLGVIDVGNEEVESVDYIVYRAQEALKYVSKEQLWLCTDCGMLMLSRESAKQKLINMSKARDILNER